MSVMMEHNGPLYLLFLPLKRFTIFFLPVENHFPEQPLQNISCLFFTVLYFETDCSQNRLNVGPEPSANSLLFSRYLLTQTGFHCGLQMSLRKSIGPL